ncbi:glutathione-disulfide reductase, partial [Pseudomonas sp. FW305-76]
IRGCVPKKLMVYAGRFADEFEDAAGFGWTVEKPRFDWGTLKTRRDAEVTRLEGIYDANLIRAGVEIVPERAVIEDPHTVRLV